MSKLIAFPFHVVAFVLGVIGLVVLGAHILFDAVGDWVGGE